MSPRRPVVPAPPRRSVALAAAVVVVDQTTKVAADLLGHWRRHGPPVVPLRNPRLSLGLAAGPRLLMLLAMAVGITLVTAYGVRAANHDSRTAWIPAVVIGGALSNLIDRILLGAVRDFLAIGHIVVVNLADLGVLVGVLGYGLACLARRSHTGSASERR
jgi:signal peptidase II